MHILQVYFCLLFFRVCSLSAVTSARCEAVYKIRNHIQNFGQSILVLYVDKLGGSILDHQHGTWSHFSGETAASVVLLLSCESSGTYAKGYVHQRKYNRIAYVNGVSHYRLGSYKAIPLNRELTVSLKLFSFSIV